MRSSRERVTGIIIGIVAIFGWGTSPLWGQSFNSGSTGADGPFSPTCTVPQGQTTCTVTINLPPSGMFNFTTITVPDQVIVKFNRNAGNTPVTMLASGDVSIQGLIDVSGGDANQSQGVTVRTPGRGGPGGFDGGIGGLAPSFLASTTGSPGLGPGGGFGGAISGSTSCTGGGGAFLMAGTDPACASTGSSPAYGVHTLLPIIGGSGGGGGAAAADRDGNGGGGGGGAILIASSGTITFAGVRDGSGIWATGGAGHWSTDLNGSIFFDGGGSGGGVRLIANHLAFMKNNHPPIDVSRRSTGASDGRVRLESFTTDWQNLFAIPTNWSRGFPGSLSTPSVHITAVGGIPAPTNASGTFLDATDVILDPSLPNLFTVSLAATNIPLGTVVDVNVVTQGVAQPTKFTSTPLTGTLASSTATANVTLTPGASVLTATATFVAAP